MGKAHRSGDSRSCGATTVSNQSGNVYVNGKLWAVDGDPDSHGNGALIASQSTVFIGGKAAILAGDQAMPDSLCDSYHPIHCDPYAVGYSDDINIGD